MFNKELYDFKQIVKDVLLTEAKRLKKLQKVSLRYWKTIDLIKIQKGKLIITGVGKSGLVGQKLHNTCKYRNKFFFLHPTGSHAWWFRKWLEKEDIVLGISYSGESDELVQILPHLKDLIFL